MQTHEQEQQQKRGRGVKIRKGPTATGDPIINQPPKHFHYAIFRQAPSHSSTLPSQRLGLLTQYVGSSRAAVAFCLLQWLVEFLERPSNVTTGSIHMRNISTVLARCGCTSGHAAARLCTSACTGLFSLWPSAVTGCPVMVHLPMICLLIAKRYARCSSQYLG